MIEKQYGSFSQASGSFQSQPLILTLTPSLKFQLIKYL